MDVAVLNIGVAMNVLQLVSLKTAIKLKLDKAVIAGCSKPDLKVHIYNILD